MLTLIQGFPESYLSGLSRDLTCLTTVSLPLTALSGQFIDQVASSGWCDFRYLLQIYYHDQSKGDHFMGKALATGVLWCLLVKVSRKYNWLAFPWASCMSNKLTHFHAMCIPNQCQESCTKLCFCLVYSRPKIFRDHFLECPALPESYLKSFFPAWWQLALVGTVVFVRMLNKTLLDGQCCELLKPNELKNGPKTGRFEKTPMEVDKASSAGIPCCICSWLGQGDGTGKE